MNRSVALVTGGARGIGAATCRKFLDSDYRVVAVDLLEASVELPQSDRLTFRQCDVSNEHDVQAIVGELIAAEDHIDVLVNVAGTVLVKPLVETTVQEYRRLIDVNLGGTFLFCKHVGIEMRKRGQGSIINLASVSGHVGQIDHALYGASKAAIIGLTKALAWEWADARIRINSVSPGSVDTAMLRGDIETESQRTGVPYEAVKQKREAEQAFGRWADPREIAEAIYFLASDSSRFITGADLLVDCGWVAR